MSSNRSILTCPHCSSLINFINDQSQIICCQTCNRLVHRSGVDSSSDPGTKFPEMMSPFRIGSEFTFQDTVYSIIGLHLLECHSGYIILWFSQTSGGKIAWLFESNQDFAVLKEDDSIVAPEFFSGLRIGQKSKIKNEKCYVEWLDTFLTHNINGEVKELPLLKDKTIVVRLGDVHATLVLAMILDKTKFIILTGSYMEFDELKSKNTRQIESWNI